MSKRASKHPSGSWKMILLLIMAGAVVLMTAPVSAEKPYVTIVAKGDQSYHMGEKVVFSGMNTDSDSTYLFITGPNLPDGGGELSSPQQHPASGDPGSFTVAKTKPDHTWEYIWYTSDLRMDAGTYTIYAVSRPETKDQFNDSTTYGTVSIIYKKPYITAEISSSSVSKGMPITVSGVAEGIPPDVQIWIFGKNYYSKSIQSVNPDASYTYEVLPEVTSHLETGQYFVIVQHPMMNNRFDIDASGDYVRDMQLNNGTNLFRISGPGSLQGSDAADALITAISDRESHDATYTNDTYTIIPFQVTDAGNVPASGASANTGVTLTIQGDKSYYLGEKVVFSGHNYDSDSTYLFITGPGVFAAGPGIPGAGGKLTSPLQAVVSGNPDSFTVVKIKPDKSWEYSWYTANLPFDAGTYTVYAASQPKTVDQLGPDAANGGIILKKPYINAGISPSSVSKGQPFTVTGSAVGNPPSVQLWIIGNNYVYTTTTPVNQDASFTFTGDGQLSGKLPEGQCYLIVQHPMRYNQFDIDVSGDYVRSLQPGNGTNLFRIAGPGSLQGSDAADALITAISDREANDSTLTNDTYTIIPFQVTDAGNVPATGASANTGITLAVQGDKSYYLGEKVVFSGHNYDSDSTYLFITGPGTFMNGPGIPGAGGKLTSPLQAVVSGNPDTFTVVKTKPDKSWEYSYYTANLPFDAGTYTVYAASQPKTADQLGPDAANVGIIQKKPFITAEVSPATISKGMPITISGVAEGIPPDVQVWILGNNYYSSSTVSVNPDASYTYAVLPEVTSHLESGQYFAIVQHPMEDNQFDFVVSGDYVRNKNNGTNLFRISGPGSLQGSDAADALTTAISDQDTNDLVSSAHDTYTIVPFQVADAGSPASQATAATTAPAQYGLLGDLEKALRSFFNN